MRWVGLLALVWAAHAQLNTGTLEGAAPPGAAVEIELPAGTVLALRAGADGRFSAALPYGVYFVRGGAPEAACLVRIRPLEITRCELRPGETQSAEPRGLPAPGAYSASQALLFQAPAVFVYPLNFAALGGLRLPLVSPWGAPWTATAFHLNGLDATDPYRPGRPVLFDDAAADDSVVFRDAVNPGAIAMDAADARIFLRGAETAWHGGLATDDTGSAFAGSNLPAGPDRGIVQRPEAFRWFTRDAADVSGPIGRHADIAATGTGQWGSQTMPQWPDGVPINSRMLLGNARGRVWLSPRDQLDALYSGSRLDLSNGGWPAGIEAALAGPMMPSFYGVEGFENLRETDHFDLVQTGWTHVFDSARVLELRYGYSTAHRDTSPLEPAATIDLLDLAPADAPISNLAVRTRHEFAAALRCGAYTFGGNWERSEARNRFAAPGGMDRITAGGQPAFDIRFNTPADSGARVDSFAPYAARVMRLPYGATLDLAFVLDAARGGPIAWTSPSPRAAIAVPIRRLTLRGGYARTYSRLAARYLDFGNPAALSAQVYDPKTGALLARFGGAWSAIAPGLRRPYADQLHLGAEMVLPAQSTFAITLLRRDQKNEIAAVNTGVPDSAYRPVAILDPGPDFIPGTFDDQTLLVYAQDPSTLGRDRYLLSNPPGLRELTEAITATAATRHRYFEVRASFTAEKSFGPTNAGSSAWTNDPGIVGALYSSPNSLINATGHPFMDRAFLGKLEGVLLLRRWQVVGIVSYLDGLPFARQLLVTGLPQGPLLLGATLRGSPEGGNRAQYVLNWNLRVARTLGAFSIAGDLLNVLNNGNKIVESDLSGPLFNQRPAVAVPPPRMLRLSARWRF